MIDFPTAIETVTAGQDLTADQTGALIDAMLSGDADNDAIAGLLLGLREKGEAVSELVGAAQAMRRHMTPIPFSGDVLLDTCGTGGSGSGTFNISTATAIVVAAAGVSVAKHGNRKATSKSGSADVLAELGVAVESSVEAVAESLERVGLCFCFAPKLHPAMKHVVGVRRSLAVPTLFNLLGPLCNPAGATHQLLGTGRTEGQRKIAAALAQLNTTRSLIVRGEDGQDEVALEGTTTAIEVQPDHTETLSWTAESFGLPSASMAQMQAADPADSARTIRAILAGQPGACRDIVIANAAAALWLVGRASDVRTAASLAAEAIDSGAAEEKLSQLAAQA
ncbi:anthranilate phosphoribosyltransferase [Roseimaritima ulvae]|uniref:Anthranilate phosphoribosyltransferase n=1 Tax=Roseimaritima ulvae TaxID=980254 RepID=A0A5B9QTW1_9BACT|nr:anthranilate phosphoribosyltransferase [Roseimaritima ulvae]QEG41352.1 Anthranilate phosphoribosyltransferase [Roseimaritima ulvae]